MQYFKEKLHPSSVKRKVLAGFLLVFVALSLALVITRFGFREMMATVDQLSAPNEKLQSLNKIFQEITTLDQLQRAEAIKNPKTPYKTFLVQSKSMVDKIDSLRLMPWDTSQQNRLLSIKNILNKRNRLFFTYLKLKSDLINNRRMSYRIDTLSTIIASEKVKVDTSVVTTQKKTITTYTKDSVVAKPKDERSRLSKFFSKKKKEPDTTKFQVQEEMSVTIDTLSVARQNKALEEVGKIMVDLEKEQRAENKKLLGHELELINSNSLFITQLLAILHEVENEELSKMNHNNQRAATVVNQNISRISILLLVFLLGAALLVYLIWMDITRSNYYKEQLEKAKEQAEELSQIKQRFLANMSHEIRTPLQSIIGFSEQLKNYHGPHLEAVGAIHSSSEHLLHIVNEVLDYSRISSGSFSLVNEPFSLFSIIKEVESAMRIQTERKRLTLLLDLEKATDFTLEGDPFRLRQVLYNLIGNAVKFTAKGYVKITLKTKEDEQRVGCTFEIMDTGMGIRPEDLSKIFNQFEQANASITHTFGGTGLGLTIVKSLVEAQGGTLQVSSEPSQGSTFKVELNYEKKQIQKTLPLKAIQPLENVAFSGKVIVVDDDSMILRLCSLILKKNGIEFITYNDPGKLIHQDPDNTITHILMDIRMPNINGIELCHALRKKYSKETVFVALTAHVFAQERQQLLDEGFNLILPKPFREEELLHVLGLTLADNPTPVSNHSVTVDFSMLRQLTMGDESLFQSILLQFQDETERDLKLLKENLNHPEASVIREIVHKLAGRVGQLGALSLSVRLHDIENEIVEGTEISQLIDEIIETKTDVTKLLNSIRISTLQQSS